MQRLQSQNPTLINHLCLLIQQEIPLLLIQCALEYLCTKLRVVPGTVGVLACLLRGSNVPCSSKVFFFVVCLFPAVFMPKLLYRTPRVICSVCCRSEQLTGFPCKCCSLQSSCFVVCSVGIFHRQCFALWHLSGCLAWAMLHVI